MRHQSLSNYFTSCKVLFHSIPFFQLSRCHQFGSFIHIYVSSIYVKSESVEFLICEICVSLYGHFLLPIMMFHPYHYMFLNSYRLETQRLGCSLVIDARKGRQVPFVLQCIGEAISLFQVFLIPYLSRIIVRAVFNRGVR